ncbi:MAG: hypothetical protein GXP49_07880 [Deltaproteobacteria bacterium]|nr:hypothetical protein [Deltaproteobacteria bacterium]
MAKRRDLNPRIACKDPEERKQELVALKKFYSMYRESLSRWRSGDKKVKFPHGTYKMRIFAKVNCLGPDESG